MNTPIYTYLEKRTLNFLKKAKEVHNNKYDYYKVVYVKAKIPVDIECPIHGSFPQTPAHHLSGSGCPDCGTISAAEKQRYKAAKEFEKKANLVHNNFYDLSNVIYIGSLDLVNIECPIHCIFPQTPANHLAGVGCPECAIISRAENQRSKAAKEFVEKANIIHNNLYDYPDVEYIDAKIPVNIECPIHGKFPQTPHNHLSGNGCPKCYSKGYSKIAIQWLESISLDIQHAENGGEFRIPNTNFKADGYHKETNTIYEFHGDVFHGNPDKFDSDYNCHPFNKDITAKELYDKTIERENEIKSLGYNLVVIWESDFITFN